jgi:hypothetical protein
MAGVIVSIRSATERTAANAKVCFLLAQSIWARVTEVRNGGNSCRSRVMLGLAAVRGLC